jgi:methylmalonyl-CoA mutase
MVTTGGPKWSVPVMQIWDLMWISDPFFRLLLEAARQAVENDVHILGVSSLAAGSQNPDPAGDCGTWKAGREDIMVIAGGVIPAQDYETLYKAGVMAIFGPGTSVSVAGKKILEILIDGLKG